jgi:hypothetical protein
MIIYTFRYKGIATITNILCKRRFAYTEHAVREAEVAGILRVGKEDGETNLVDLLTKVITGQKRWDCCHCLFC